MLIYLATFGQSSTHLAMIKNYLLNEMPQIPVLLSFAYKEQTIKALDAFKKIGRPRKIFLDSGAYSAKQLGIKIDRQEYLEFIKQYRQQIDVCANLDVIGDHKGTADNQNFFEKNNIQPLPVYHRGEPFSVYEAMLKKYRYVALGGMTKNTTQRSLWLARCFIAAQTYKTKLHGFGVTHIETLYSFPFFSTDATTWGSGGRYGMVFSTSAMSMLRHKSTQRTDIRNNLHTLKTKLTNYADRDARNVKYFLKTQDTITRFWEQRGVTWNDDDRVI